MVDPDRILIVYLMSYYVIDFIGGCLTPEQWREAVVEQMPKIGEELKKASRFGYQAVRMEAMGLYLETVGRESWFGGRCQFDILTIYTQVSIRHTHHTPPHLALKGP